MSHRWILAEYDVKQFEMTDDKLKDLVPDRIHEKFVNIQSHKEIEVSFGSIDIYTCTATQLYTFL